MATPVSATATLPRHMTIKGDNGRYLALKSDGLLTFDADQRSFLTCHEVIYNFDDSEGTFSVRAPNGRFWSRDASHWIRANGSTEPPATTDKRTRFKLVRFESGRLGFLSALDDRYLKRYDAGIRGYNAVQSQPDPFTQVEVSDGSEHAIHLPRFITFKGDNDQFLLVRKEWNNENWWLQFSGQENDLSRDEAINRVFQMVDGSLAFYNIHRQAYWRNRALDNNSWVWAEFQGAVEGDSRCHFWPIRLSTQMLALTSKSNNRICKRLTNYWTNCLSASANGTNDVTTRLIISEATLSRSIFNVKYLLELASTMDQRLLMVGEGSVINRRDEPADMTVTVTVFQNLSTQSTFSNSYTITQKISTEFTAGIPGIAANQTTIEIGAEQNFSREWGETAQEGVQFQTEYVVRNVKPQMTAKATVFASTARMRVPFTYTSRERGANGIDRPSENHIDGVFDGVSAYNIHAILSDGESERDVPLSLANGFYRKED
ncbi:hypothetical protein SELMODRAFT_447143 [Selaginella moellendorffii]|uniref:Agglutinin domain-containing protein n=1 Tax=Selaginella moellendorffii TaxID=88036 RepID=D8SX47_SELML|nr:uncharacterized protein LOC9651968 [Selaginella moellendorffii]EFJ10972.1 hypothetical protein SELMODRAFT_447143 [Selaginella moellendorffii]|eukprot:XP_002987898.1 uncharacterized protein LOC9651968 [Selaginella moellendorffii]